MRYFYEIQMYIIITSFRKKLDLSILKSFFIPKVFLIQSSTYEDSY